MDNIVKIKQLFKFSEKDANNLIKVKKLMEEYKDEVSNKVYSELSEFEEIAHYFTNKEILANTKKEFAGWFGELFNGIYDNKYFSKIRQIGISHAKMEMPAHYRNVSFSITRTFCHKIIESNFSDNKERIELLNSVNKIIDINHDIMSSSHREELLDKVSITYRIESNLIKFSEHFNYALNLILVIALMIISLGIVGLFAYDIYNLITGHLDHGIIHILGTLLMLWVMIELMDTEIEHLKNGKFSINIFVEVVLVAVIRDVLIGTLEHGDLLKQTTLVGTILVLGIVYWLISKVETKKSKKMQ